MQCVLTDSYVVIKSGRVIFSLYIVVTGARSQLYSVVRLQNKMAGGWHRTTLPSVPIYTSHGDFATAFC